MSAGRRLRRLLPNLALLAVSLLVILGAAELAVRLFVDLGKYKPIGVYDVDPDNPYAFLPHHERLYETSEFRYTVSTNRFGRRDVEWSADVLSQPQNVLVIGDSFVLGNGVEEANSIPTLLESHLARPGRAREVLNFGMPASGPADYRVSLEQALRAGIAARTVLVGIFIGNDFYPEAVHTRTSAPAEPVSPPPRGPRSRLLQFVRLRVSQSPLLVGWVLRLGGLLGISVYDTAGSYIFLRTPTAEQEALFDAILAHVGRMQELCNARARRLYVVIFPNRLQVENRDALTNAVLDAERPNRRILAWSGERGLDCLDLLPVLRAHWTAHGEPLYFAVDRHLNAKGTHVAARAISDFLAERAGGQATEPSPLTAVR